MPGPFAPLKPPTKSAPPLPAGAALTEVRPAHADRLWSLPRLSLNGDYQDRRMLEALLSGLPFALGRRLPSLGID